MFERHDLDLIVLLLGISRSTGAVAAEGFDVPRGLEFVLSMLLPHLPQNFASGSSLFPQFSQNILRFILWYLQPFSPNLEVAIKVNNYYC